ncbi:MAG: OprO/OprP family phosphate-selective porin [Candidatus Eisenbacteria bacterium]|nr:OprO/OprP family phosphate-selective porin [Candidatus Eisenbacteria bacterium]
MKRLFRAFPWLMLLLSVSPVRAQDSAAAEDTSVVTRAELQGLLDGLNEQMQTLQADTDKLKKFKFSGYIQARNEMSEASNDSVRVSGSPATITTPNQSRFYIRRARLKLTYDSSPLSQAVVYFDGGTDRTIRLLEAYVTLLDPWTPNHDHQLTVGQFNVPFGFEIERSSSVRELPERSRAENILFSGERDRGLKLDSQWTLNLKTSLAVLNGAGINSADFPNTDPTRGKDVVARARWTQGTWDVAGSYYWGRQVTALTGPDVLTDKTRIGFDAQTFWSLPAAGGGSLRGEVYSGKDVNADSLRVLVVAPTTANPNRLLRTGANREHLATDMLGWYVMAVQNIGERFQAVVRFDTYDPNTDLEHDAYQRWSLGVNAFYDGFTRATISYDAIKTDVSAGAGRFTDPHDNLWTFQIQHKF